MKVKANNTMVCLIAIILFAAILPISQAQSNSVQGAASGGPTTGTVTVLGVPTQINHAGVAPVTLPPSGGSATDQAPSQNIGASGVTVTITGLVVNITSGSIGPTSATAESSSTVQGVNILTGLVKIIQIGDQEAKYPHKGVLVCTGNMIETANLDSKKPPQRSPRRNHTLVLERNESADPLPISERVLHNYRESLTPFQRDELWTEGGLEPGAPVFYVVKNGEVAWFGHAPNFRIPALNKEGQAATPRDFVPPEVHQSDRPDLAEAIFGWIDEGKNVGGQRAGRVSFSDGRFVDAHSGVWYSAEPIRPSALSGPKITTFQHYLVQDKNEGHDPDSRVSLAHYGSRTEIRGHKLYWHKGNIPVPLAADGDKESQLTRIIPLNPGVRFTSRIQFENLRGYELGALAWALQLPGEQGQVYRHKLGMGKPLGMGSVSMTSKLQLTERRDNQTGRYSRLFSDGRLANGANTSDPSRFIEAFEQFILKDNNIAPEKQRLFEVPRIGMLLAMLQWREATDEWLDKTRYLLIQHPQHDNEYKQRPVLPDPLVVGGQPVEQSMAEERLGVVIHVPPNRYFGYIKPDVPRPGEKADGIFFHFNELAGGRRTARKDQRVRFKVRTGVRGPEAYEVVIEEESAT